VTFQKRTILLQLPLSKRFLSGNGHKLRVRRGASHATSLLLPIRIIGASSKFGEDGHRKLLVPPELISGLIGPIHIGIHNMLGTSYSIMVGENGKTFACDAQDSRLQPARR
jgi:hypothetical protein